MEKNQELFEYIVGIGEYNGDTFIIDNTGDYGKQKGEKHFIVFVKGGLRFDISKELDDSQKEPVWIYFFLSEWEGPTGITEAKEALAYLYFINEGNNHFPQLNK